MFPPTMWDPRLIVLVLHNNDLSQVTWEMWGMEDDPKFEASQQLRDCNYAAFKAMLSTLWKDDPILQTSFAKVSKAKKDFTT